jgi:phage baseplate assembly protein W
MALTSKSFRDFSLTFEKNAVTNDILALNNEAAIKASVKNIVLYNFYEKPFDPAFGGNIIGLLFENFIPNSAQRIKKRLQEAIDTYEPRVAVYEIKVKVDENNNELNVSIAYVIMGIPAKFDSIDIAFKP